MTTTGAFPPCVRDMNDMHHAVQEIHAFSTLQKATLRKARVKLFELVKEVQQMKGVVALQTGYYLVMTSANVVNMARLPFMHPSTTKVVERLSTFHNVPGRGDMVKMLKELENRYQLLPKVFASMDNDRIWSEDERGILGPDPKQIFSISTLPALFGYCWTVELRNGFIEFVKKIIEAFPDEQLDTLNAHSHWLLDMFRSVGKATNINQFLQRSVGPHVVRFLAECQTTAQVEEKKGDFAMRIVDDMIAHAEIFPADTREIMISFVKGKTGSERMERFETVFVRPTLCAAIVTPFLYSLCPDTYFSGSEVLMRLSALAKMFQAAHTKSGELGVKMSRLADLLLGPVPQPPGPVLHEIQSLTGVHYLTMIFSVRDVVILAWILKHTREECGDLKRIAGDVIASLDEQSYDLGFFRHEAWRFDVFGTEKPDILELALDKPLNLKSSTAACVLFDFMAVTRIEDEAGPSQEKYMDWHWKVAMEERVYEQDVFMRRLNALMPDSEPMMRRELYPALEDEIRRYDNFVRQNTEMHAKIAEQTQVLIRERESLTRKMNELKPILYYYLMLNFIGKRSELKQQLLTLKDEMLLHSTLFGRIFKDQMENIKRSLFELFDIKETEAQDDLRIIEESRYGMVRQFHGFCSQQLSLADFQRLHGSYSRCDKLVLNISSDLIESMCIAHASVRLRKLIGVPDLFKFACGLLREDNFQTCPIECLDRMAAALDLLSDVHVLEIGEKPSQDELKVLFHYAMLSSSLPSAFSLGKYIDHIIGEVLCDDVLTEREKVSLGFLSGFIAMLEPLLSEY